MRRRLVATVALVVISGGLAGCGGSSGGSSSSGAATPTTTLGAAPVPTTGAAVPAAIATEPTVSVPPGPPPTHLVTKDLVVGTGAVARAGDNVLVQYVGVNYADGKVFDASWTDGPGGAPQPFPFQLGAGQVIAGWDQGVPGMRVGGRRQLVIPPALAYGNQAQGPITPNETLVFIVDLLSIS